jgi:preprotein translocase subunit SecD
MLKVSRWRLILVAVVAAFGALFAAPNFLPASVRAALPDFAPKQAINLGLDLRGGSQIMLEIDVEDLHERQLGNVLEQMRGELRNAEPRITNRDASLITGSGRVRIGDIDIADRAARVRITESSELERALQVLAPLRRSPMSADDILTFEQGEGGLIDVRFTPAEIARQSREAAQQSIEVVRRRIDPNGTSEVSITRQGDRRIVVQAPGVADPQELKRLVGQTASMTFHMVRPPGATTMDVLPYPGMDENPETVERRARLTGEHLVNAYAGPDPQNPSRYALFFAFDNPGTRTFCRITREFSGQRFAILLDNQVLTAPVINEPICGGSGQITGSFDLKSAAELARMLKAGALPANLNVIEERTVDASLGQEAIESGTNASIVAGIVTLVFMLLAYGLFGLFACLALIINGVLIVATMSLIGAALTLPGIAGLILTIAMAVDANVLIYERMREEAALGRGPAMAIEAGFNRAMITIVDANLTTILAALILFQFGAGPVRGFAWTLSIGVVTSVFTAVLVTQILISWWFRISRPKTLPI